MNIQRLEEARRALDRAHLALAAGLADQAAADTSKSIVLNPDFIDTRLVEAQIHLNRRQPAEALRSLDALNQLQPASRHWPRAVLLRIEALAQSGQLAPALKLAQVLTRQYPDDVRPHRVLAALCVQIGQTADAIESLRRVLALEPSDSASRRVLAELLEGHPQEAAEVLEPSLGDDAHDDRLSHLRLARLLERCGRLGEAEEHFSTLLLEEKEDANLWLEAGLLADGLGADRLATKRLRQAIELSPRRPAIAPAAWAALARVHMHAGRFDRAGWCWWRLSRIKSDDAQASTGLATCALLAGHQRLAGQIMQQAAKISSPQQRRASLARHWLDAAGGREIQRANLLTGDAANPSAASPLASLVAQAAQTLAQHTEAQPARADAFYQRALCHEALGQPNEAAAAVAQALRINPRYADAQRFISRLQAAGGRLAA